jgi:hypothetical protein
VNNKGCVIYINELLRNTNSDNIRLQLPMPEYFVLIGKWQYEKLLVEEW